MVAIKYHPRSGQILLCDFEPGFRPPEMVKKKRPVVVLTGSIHGRSNLVTVVPISTVEPKPQQKYHYKIPMKSMPMLGRFQQGDSWVKGDMLYTVGFHRLFCIELGGKAQNGKRIYFTRVLGAEQMKEIRRCVLNGLNLGRISHHVTLVFIEIFFK